MVSLIFGAIGTVDPDQDVVRRTNAPVNPDKSAAVSVSDPQPNIAVSDPDAALGMGQRQLASHYHPSVKYAPAWAPAATAEHDAIIDRQVATSGTAAAREMVGQFGHGTMSYAVGIEPTIRDGMAFGNEYFAADRPEAQFEAGEDGVKPPADQAGGIGGVIGYGTVAKTDAFEAAFMDRFLNG